MIQFIRNTKIVCLVFLLSVIFKCVVSNNYDGCIEGCKCPDYYKYETMKCPPTKLMNTFPTAMKYPTEVLTIHNNELEELPANLSQILPNLTEIHLKGNKLRVLPSRVFANLKKLNYVGLTNNKITDMGSYLFEGCQEESITLELIGNEISNIDADAFKGSTFYLTTLFLQKNALKELHKDVFADTNKLHRLDLSVNGLETLHPELFRNLEEAFFVKLRENRLSSLHEKLFENMRELETLDLSYNRLSVLPQRIFSKNSALKTLKLNNNVFNTPPVGIPDNVQVSMDGNPIFCDCDLKMRALNPSFYKQFNDLNKVICANDQHQNKTVDVYLEELNCETTTTEKVTTVTPKTVVTGIGPIVVTKITTRTVIYDNTEKGKDSTSWPIVLGVLLGILVLIVVVALFMYLYRRRIRDKIIEGTLTLTRQKKKKMEHAVSAEDFKYHDIAGWNGAKTAMLKQTEGNV